MEVAKKLLIVLVLPILVLSRESVSKQVDISESCADILLLENKKLKIPKLSQAQASNAYRLMRANVAHSWIWGQLYPEKNWQKLLEIKGVVAGDTHLGNFTPMFLDGKTTVRYSDFDDSGVGPVIGDVMRFLAATKLVDKDIKYKDMLSAHLEGVKSPSKFWPYKIPAFLENFFKISEKDAMAIEKKYLDGLVKRDLFIEGEKGLRKISDPKQKQRISKSVEKLVPGEKVFDVVFREILTGGSSDVKRYWVLVGNKVGRRRILEFKQIMESALGSIEEQPEHLDRYKLVMPVFWEKTFDAKNPTVVSLDDSDDQYQVRVRNGFSDLFKGFYDSRMENAQNREEVVLYAIYLLGQAHGRQSGVREKVLKAAANFELFHETLKMAVKK